MASIKIDNGLKTYDIENSDGVVRGQITINPKDINFFERAQAMGKSIQDKLDDISKLPDTMSEVDVLKQLSIFDAEIKTELNILFDDPNLCDVVFGNQNCLNTSGGVTFVERFMNAIMPVIRKEFKTEAEKSSKRIEKYTSQVVDK